MQITHNHYISWNKLYPKSEYGKETSRILHYLLAWSSKSLENWVKGRTINGLLLTKDSSANNLTPLMIACAKGNKVAMNLFLPLLSPQELKKAIDQQDKFGWTFLHHAATNADMWELISLQGLNTNKLTHLFGSPYDIARLTGIETPENPLLKKITFVDELGQVSPLTSEGFLSAFQAHYRDESLFLEENIAQLWSDPEIEMPSYCAIFRKSLEEGIFPEVKLQPSRELSLFGVRMYEVVSHQEIAAGTLICEYSGLAIPDKEFDNDHYKWPIDHSEHLYVYDQIDAEKWGNIAGRINHGWPNVQVLSLYSKGAKKSFVVTLETIAKGEPLLFSYGGLESFVYQPLFLFAKEKMETFFLQLEDYRRECQCLQNNIESSIKDWLTHSNLLLKFTFPFQTPSALLYLYFKDIVPLNTWKEMVLCFSDPLFRSIQEGLLEIEPRSLIMSRRIVIHLKEYENVIENYPTLKKLVADWVVTNIDKYSFLAIMKVLHFVAKDEKKSGKTLPNAISLLDNYVWSKDINNPLGLNTLPEDMYKISKILIPNKKHRLTSYNDALKKEQATLFQKELFKKVYEIDQNSQ